MKRSLVFLMASVALAGLAPAPVSAQFFEIMSGRLNEVTSDPFGCTGASKCNLHQRYYADIEPALINGPNGPVDGWPDYRPTPDRYVGDEQSTSNFPGLGDPSNACEAWYSVWSGTVNPGTGTFLSYYAAQSTIINVSETGDSNSKTCTPGTLRGIACFGAADTTSATSVNSGTPQGTIPNTGGLAVVPVPRVVTSNLALDTVLLSWVAANNVTRFNKPSANGTPCPVGSTFNDLTATTAPDPVYGVRLFVHAIANGGAFRALADLEGAALDCPSGVPGCHLTALANPGSLLSCVSAGDCPGVHVVPCSGVIGGSCASDGITFAPVAQNIEVSRAQINAALGTDGPMGNNNNAVFNSKVIFRGAVPGSHAAPGITSVNPSLVSPFSPNSTRVSFGALISRIQFVRDPLVAGSQVTLTWEVIGGSFLEFRVERATDGVNFRPVGTVDGGGESIYSFTDVVRGRAAGTITYRVIGLDAANEPQQIFTAAQLAPSAPARRDFGRR